MKNVFFIVMFSLFCAFSYAQDTPPEPDLIDAKDVIGLYYYSAFQPNATKWDLKADSTFELIYYVKNTSPYAPSEFKREKAKGTWICRDDTIIMSPTDALPEKYLVFHEKLFKVYSETADGKLKDIPVSAARVAEDSYWVRKKQK